MFPLKGNMAQKSGMRGMGPAPPHADPSAPGQAADGGAGVAGIDQFIHGPDEAGDHHLNITKLHAHIMNKGKAPVPNAG